ARDRLVQRPAGSTGFSYMAHLANRRKIVVPAALALAAVLIAWAVAAWSRSAAHAHAGGDPGGRLMAKIAPVVRVVPGFGHGHIPWIAFPCDSCQFPVTYAIKVEPRWDSCDGMAGTFGWDPVVLQVGFRWTGSSHALAGIVNARLGARGWPRAAAGWWGVDAEAVGIGWHGHAGAEELALCSPILAGMHQWMVLLEAKPQGQLVKGC